MDIDIIVPISLVYFSICILATIIFLLFIFTVIFIRHWIEAYVFVVRAKSNNHKQGKRHSVWIMVWSDTQCSGGDALRHHFRL